MIKIKLSDHSKELIDWLFERYTRERDNRTDLIDLDNQDIISLLMLFFLSSKGIIKHTNDLNFYYDFTLLGKIKNDGYSTLNIELLKDTQNRFIMCNILDNLTDFVDYDDLIDHFLKLNEKG